MSGCDLLLDLAVDRAMTETVPVKWVMAQGVMPGRTAERAARNPRWSLAEDEFVQANLQRLSLDEIGTQLGRSGKAVKVRMVRREFPSPSKTPGYLTGNGLARLLGVDIHAVVRLFDLGILRMHVLPNKRRILQIGREAAIRWAVNPENWIYFRHEKVRDARLRRLLELRRGRWPDKWLRIGEAGRRVGVDSRTLNQRCRTGKLPAKQWGNWWIKESALEGLRIITRQDRREGANLRFSPAADEFILSQVADGLGWTVLERLMKQPAELIRLRYLRLMEIRGGADDQA